MEEKRKLYLQGIDNVKIYNEYEVPLDVAFAVETLLEAEEVVRRECPNLFKSKDIQDELW